MVINITGGNKTIRSLTKSLVEYCADKLKLNDTILLDIDANSHGIVMVKKI